MASAAEHAVALLHRLPGEVQEAYTTDGSLDFDGNPALKHRTGGWRACRSVLGTEFCYCLAFYGISYNLVTYLTGVLGQSNVAAARNVSTWQATCFLMPLAGAIVADSYWGRYRTMVVSCSVGVAGLQNKNKVIAFDLADSRLGTRCSRVHEAQLCVIMECS